MQNLKLQRLLTALRAFSPHVRWHSHQPPNFRQPSGAWRGIEFPGVIYVAQFVHGFVARANENYPRIWLIRLCWLPWNVPNNLKPNRLRRRSILLPFGRGVSTRQLHQIFIKTATSQGLYFYLNYSNRIIKKRSSARIDDRLCLVLLKMFVFMCAACWTHFLFRSHLYNSTLKRLCKYPCTGVFYNDFSCGKLWALGAKGNIKILCKNVDEKCIEMPANDEMRVGQQAEFVSLIGRSSELARACLIVAVGKCVKFLIIEKFITKRAKTLDLGGGTLCRMEPIQLN